MARTVAAILVLTAGLVVGAWLRDLRYTVTGTPPQGSVYAGRVAPTYRLRHGWDDEAAIAVIGVAVAAATVVARRRT